MQALGLDHTQDAELAETPRRVTELMSQLFASSKLSAPELSTFPATNNEPVLIQALPFRSTCVHHLLPFFGSIDIAYIPGEKLAGFGGFVRMVEFVSRKPQVQERLVEELAQILQASLEPQGLLIRCRARQMCVEMRQNTQAVFVSYASRGTLVTGQIRENMLTTFAQADSPL